MLILSYVKILNTSFELLLPVDLVDKSGKVIDRAVYYSGDLKFFGTQHLPYAILAIIMSLTFNVLPLILLTLYPCRCFHKFLNKCWKGSGIHHIMDNFYRSYKTTPRNYRYCGVIYLYLRVINLALLLVSLSPGYFTLIAIFYMSVAMFIACVQPHKIYWHNIINAGLFFIVAVMKILEQALEFSLGVYEQHFLEIYFHIDVILFCVPPFYGLLLLLHHLLGKRVVLLLSQKGFGKVLRKLQRKSMHWNDESFPHRLSEADEYTHLVSVSN